MKKSPINIRNNFKAFFVISLLILLGVVAYRIYSFPSIKSETLSPATENSLQSRVDSTREEKPFVIRKFDNGSALLSDGTYIEENNAGDDDGQEWLELRVQFMDKCNYDDQAGNYCNCVFAGIKAYSKNDISVASDLISRSETEKPNEILNAMYLCKDVQN